MGIIRLDSVSKQYGGQIVLDNVSLELHSGRTVGLVGRNGAGKTTLFEIIAGLMQPDLGTVVRSKGIQIGYLPQEPEIKPGRTLYEEVATALSEVAQFEAQLQEVSAQLATISDHRELARRMADLDRASAQFAAAGGYRMEQRLMELLAGVGFEESDHSLPVEALSGGQKSRAALVKLLVGGRRFLLLDEPTNHLDIDAVRWLEKFLASHGGGAVIISHDRYLLDRVADQIIEIEDRQARTYTGNYSTYLKTREDQELAFERQYEKDRAFIEKERDFIARHLAGQRTKEAQGRRTRLERRIADGELVLESPRRHRHFKLDFGGDAIADGVVLRAESVSKSYGSKRLFADLTVQVEAGLRWGITGPNGAGKSTLLRILMGHVAAERGQIDWHSRSNIGYYAQEASFHDPARSVLDEIRSTNPALSEERVRTLLGAFLLSGDAVFKRLGDLSGGEQSRVRLVKLLMASPNVLVLDEPTNHLDIPSREAVEDALKQYTGTLIAVSHDRYFLDRVVDRLLVMRTDGCRVFAGNYSFYIEQIERERRSTDDDKPAPPRPRTPPDQHSGERATRKFDSLSVDDIEARLMEQEALVAGLQAAFGDPDVYRNADALIKLRADLDAAQQELDLLEQAWLERAEES